MYYDFTVPIPQVKGKITHMKKGKITYIQLETGRKYIPQKQYTIPVRVSIGKLDPDHPGMMYPNERYSDHFPDAPMPEERPEADRSCALRIGSYVAIKKVLEDYKLPEMLKNNLGNDYGLFLDLVSFMIIDEDNVGLHYPDYAFCHPLFSEGMRVYSDAKVSRMLNSISKEQVNGFLNDWNKGRDRRQRIYISYDSTNKNCSAGDVDLVEFGKAKDDKGLPVFNVALAFDRSNRVPLLYEEYPGSITDVSQLPYMVDKVEEYGYKNVGFILDRGYFSKDNIRYMEEKKYAFIIMIKGRKELVASLVDKHRNTFETKRDCSIRHYKVYGKTVSAKLYDDDTRNRYIHIYFNPSKQAAEREAFEQRIEKYRTYLEKHVGTDTKFSKAYHDFFDITYNKKGVMVSVSEKADAIERQIRLCGYFCFVTSEEMTASAALTQYKGRDISEKLFRSDKTFLGSNSMRTHTARALSTKMLAEFVALIVRNRIYNLLRETMQHLNTRAKYMNVPKAIRELEKIEMVRRNNGHYRLDHAITKTQKTILSSFGLADEDVLNSAASISSHLSEHRSILTDDGEDNAPDEMEDDFYGEDEIYFCD